MAVPEAGNIEMAIYDISGRRVAEKEITVESSGEVEVELDVAGLVSGIYTLNASFGTSYTSKRVVLAK
ncbi:MAG: hypothetical protein DRH44_07415 [Candidatus Coatesbacteria bacterium]|nr:MAG: hypothetical protein DRH44_07415 [Candidatus Coatesbacteria bacterium]